MKKFTLIVCALATTVASFAGQMRESKAVMRTTAPVTRYAEAKLATDEPINALASRLADLKKDTVWVPYVTDNTFNAGVPSLGLRYIEEADIITPLVESLTFYNYYGLKSSWVLNGEEVANDTAFVMPLGKLGRFDMPLMKTPSVVADTVEYIIPDYEFGALFTSFYAEYGFKNTVNVAPADLKPLTKCHMHTEMEIDPWGDQTYGTDWTYVGAGSMGNYSYGTKLKNPYLSTDDKTVYMDTILSYIANPSVIYIASATLGIYSYNTVLGEGDEVRLSLYPVTEEGIDFENPLGSATATIDNYVPYSSSSKWLGLLTFNFMDVDPITGAETKVPVIAEGDFVAVLENINNGTADFGILTDYLDGVIGETYFVFTDANGELNIKSMWQEPSSLLLNFNAILPEFVAPEFVEFASNDADSKEIEIPSNVWDEDMEIDADEWITVEVATQSHEETEEGETYDIHDLVDVLTISVEATEEPRVGEILINALGKEIVIKVYQGQEPQGINNIKAVNDNKMYNVLGVEVNEDYKGIVIRNGEKFVR
jgi:hypothetical protein